MHYITERFKDAICPADECMILLLREGDDKNPECYRD